MDHLGDINWPGLALGYVGYRGVQAAMAVGNKRKHPTQNSQGFRKKIRRKPDTYRGKRYSRPYAMKHAMDSRIVPLYDMKTHDLSSGADSFGSVQVADILNCPALGRYAGLYRSVRILKIKVEWFATPYAVQCVSIARQNQKGTAELSFDYMLKQPGVRFHDLRAAGKGYNAARTMNLANIPVFNEFLDCDTLGTKLSIANSTIYDAAISYGIRHFDHAPVAGADYDFKKVEMKVCIVAQFFGLQENPTIS